MKMKANVGDTVHVKGTIVRGSSALNYPMVRFALAAGATGEVCVRDDDIVHVEPAPLKVGDCVSWVSLSMEENTGQILAIDSNVAWVKLPNGNRIDRYLSVLERADDKRLPGIELVPRPLKVGDKVRNTQDGYDVGYIDRFWNNAHGVPMAAVSPTYQSFPVAYLERVK